MPKKNDSSAKKTRPKLAIRCEVDQNCSDRFRRIILDNVPRKVTNDESVPPFRHESVSLSFTTPDYWSR